MFSAEIDDGRARVKPFDVKLGNNMAKVEGSIGLDQSLDYTITTDLETGKAGAALNSLIASQLGQTVNATKAKVNFGVGGTFADPKITIKSIDYGQGQVQTAAEEKVEKEVEKAKEEAKQKVEEKKEAVKKEAEEKIAEETENLKKEAEKKVGEEGGEVIDKTKKEAEKKINDLFKKKN